jgi:hypothetical protein
MQVTRLAMDEKNGMTFGLYQNFLGVWRHYLVYIHSDWNNPTAEFGEHSLWSFVEI